MEQNLRFVQVFGRLAALKIAQPNLLLITFEDSFYGKNKNKGDKTINLALEFKYEF